MLSSSPLWPRLWLSKQKQLNQKLDSKEAVDQFQKILHQTAIGRSRQLIKGIKAYQRHPVEREDLFPAKTVWSRGTTKLLDYGSDDSNACPVLVIPSLINRYDILDLDADHSLMRYIAANRMRPFVVDWDVPGEEEKDFSIGDYIERRLIPILDFINSNHPSRQVHVLGYCMGGLLALALTMICRDVVRSLMLLATPWHTGTTTIGSSTNVEGDEYKELLEQLEPQLSHMNYLPVSMLQIMFSCMQPTHVMRKYMKFASGDMDGKKARLFVLTEDWLNNGIPLTAAVARELIGSIYGENITGQLRWKVCGRTIDPRALSLPVYIVVPGKDRIVPPESALPLARLIKGAVLQEPMLGHVGLLASLKAPREVWAPLTKWLVSV
ncbi:MAG: alpha/beta fold hydrolase [Alphaproteobacteria bacterium]|nr:alpha/beta fold hydrolase [Alphaproteobacteria bacterium]